MSRHRRDDTGATAVEFAFVFPIALALLAVVLTFGLRTLYSGLAEHAARVVARSATLQGPNGYPTDAAIQARLMGFYDSALIADPQSVLVQRPGTGPQGQGRQITITITYDVPVVGDVGRLASVLPGLGDALASLSVITATSTARLE